MKFTTQTEKDNAIVEAKKVVVDANPDTLTEAKETLAETEKAEVEE